jgi:hypothetical protein
MTEEAAYADTVAAELFVQKLQHIIEEGDYSPKQIFKIDGTALFWTPGLTSLDRKNWLLGLRLSRLIYTAFGW